MSPCKRLENSAGVIEGSVGNDDSRHGAGCEARIEREDMLAGLHLWFRGKLRPPVHGSAKYKLGLKFIERGPIGCYTMLIQCVSNKDLC